MAPVAIDADPSKCPRQPRQGRHRRGACNLTPEQLECRKLCRAQLSMACRPGYVSLHPFNPQCECQDVGDSYSGCGKDNDAICCRFSYEISRRDLRGHESGNQGGSALSLYKDLRVKIVLVKFETQDGPLEG